MEKVVVNVLVVRISYLLMGWEEEGRCCIRVKPVQSLIGRFLHQILGEVLGGKVREGQAESWGDTFAHQGREKK